MDNNKSSQKNNEKIHHTANFLASLFLLSKRSLKKIYCLNPSAITILRYICDSIDLNYLKRKSFQTQICQKQIAKHCHCSPRTVSTHIGLLRKKRLLKFNDKTLIYQVGWSLFAYANIAYTKDVRKFCVGVRCTQNLRTSNASNSTKSCYASTESQSTSFQTKSKVSELTQKQRHNGMRQAKEIKKLIQSKIIGNS